MSAVRQSPTGDADALAQKLDQMLESAELHKRDQNRLTFAALYPRLELWLRKRRKNVVIATFNELISAKVCSRKFDEWLKEERSLRDSAGNPACCYHCGARLSAPAPQADERVDKLVAESAPGTKGSEAAA